MITKDVRDKLVTDNIGLAYHWALRFRSLKKKLGRDDAVQEAMFALTRAADHYDEGRGRFSTVASVFIINHLKELHRRMCRPCRAEAWSKPDRHEVSKQDRRSDGREWNPTLRMEADEAWSLMREVLPPEQFEAMRLRYEGDGMPVGEVAGRMGVPMSTMSMRLKVAKRKTREAA